MMNAILGVGGRPCRSSSFAPIYRCFTSFSSFQDSAPRPARVVVVGSGRMGQIRSSLLCSNPKFELVGIVDNVLSGAEKLASQYRVRIGCCMSYGKRPSSEFSHPTLFVHSSGDSLRNLRPSGRKRIFAVGWNRLLLSNIYTRRNPPASVGTQIGRLLRKTCRRVGDQN